MRGDIESTAEARCLLGTPLPPQQLKGYVHGSEKRSVFMFGGEQGPKCGSSDEDDGPCC